MSIAGRHQNIRVTIFVSISGKTELNTSSNITGPQNLRSAAEYEEMQEKFNLLVYLSI